MRAEEVIQIDRFHPRQRDNQKIENLNRMLDNQIEIVNNLFEKDNAFDAIEAKLKQLEVKLSLIKQDSHLNSGASYQQSSLSNTHRRDAHQFSSTKYQGEAAIETPFESLQQYKSLKQIGKVESIKKKSSGQKQFKFYNDFESGKKLNFEGDGPMQLALEGKTTQKTRKTKIKQRIVNRSDEKCRSVQSPVDFCSRLKCGRGETAKQTRQHISSSSNTNNRKRRSHMSSCKQILKASQHTKSLRSSKKEKKAVLTETNSRKQQKRIQSQLSSYKHKNGILKNQLKELRAYKIEYERLRTIFVRNRPTS